MRRLSRYRSIALREQQAPALPRRRERVFIGRVRLHARWRDLQSRLHGHQRRPAELRCVGTPMPCERCGVSPRGVHRGSVAPRRAGRRAAKGGWSVGSGAERVGNGVRRVGNGFQPVGRGIAAVGTGYPAVGNGIGRVGNGTSRVGNGYLPVGNGIRRVGNGLIVEEIGSKLSPPVAPRSRRAPGRQSRTNAAARRDRRSATSP